jgi:hypothetical protein
MSFLDKLKTLVHIDVSKLEKFEIHLIHIDTGSNNKNIEIKDNVVTVNTQTITGKEKELVSDILKLGVEEGQIVIDEDSKKLLKEVKSIEEKGENKTVLEFFKGKIPATDHEILRAAYIIKQIYEMHSPVNKLRNDLLYRYGKRGINISNLCTAGYFTTLIKPLYEEMAALPDFSLEKFQERYNVLVEQYPFAVFVSSRDEYQTVKTEILNKIERNKKYGIKRLNIHGIGRSNVTKIQEVLHEIKDSYNWPPQIDSDNTFINAEITF